MKINVDDIQGLLDIYRSALENKIPVAPGLRDHFVQNRKRLLDGFKKMASAQSMILQSMAPENETEAAQLEEAKRIVDEFGEWVKTS
ncbi:hypothetical protein [Massilia aerilata]|uniref:Uncharacterized protein n=1 Tax=Massilia aerilata TaxID=453817 RepID=A0ABW0S3J0_9BURK